MIKKRMPALVLMMMAVLCTHAQQNNSSLFSSANHIAIRPEDSERDIIRKAASVAPSARQLRWQQLEVTGFIHFGINTFTNKEWGDGSESPLLFDPSHLDARQWARVCRDAGIRQIILTAKHHDGFCLWPSRYTAHSVKNSPWKNGRGDVVKEVADACREYGLGFGVYLSPWDRHSPYFGDPVKYNDYFVNQLTELLTNYGKIEEVWFDGANGEGPNGKKQVYDFNRWYAHIRKLQPDAVIAVMGPDVRWVGTESGYGRETEWSVLPADAMLQETIAANSQQAVGFAPMNLMDDDLGSRAKILKAKSLMWYPAETDVSIRPGWFYHPAEDSAVKSPQKLMDIYYSSVGRNGVLLLNIPPDKRGLIHENDVRSLLQWKRMRDETFAVNLLASSVKGDSKEKRDLTDNDNRTVWTTKKNDSTGVIEFVLKSPQRFDVLLLQEDIRKGQRIERFRVEYKDPHKNEWQPLVRGTTVGYKRIFRFPAVEGNALRIIIESSRTNPILAEVGLYKEAAASSQDAAYPFRDTLVPVEKRIADLIARLTLEEKVSLTGNASPGVARLGIPPYNWWNEALHGVARAGLATVFPQAIGLAATFNDSLMLEVADVISTEARAKYNLSTAAGRHLQYMGLTFWSPNINIFRDPRWGRGQETYGEDPFLTATMGTAFVKGLQGNDPHYLKTAAAAKHFAVHSGPEKGRHGFNAIVDEKDLRETYLYAFKKLVDAGVESIMCAYNRINDQPCCASNHLLQRLLRAEWKFRGHIVTDCGALYDMVRFHKFVSTHAEAAAAGLKAGVNLDCSDLYQKNLLEAYHKKLITEKNIDSALAALLRTQFKLGFYDDRRQGPYSKLGAKHVNSPEHIALARKAAQQSMVLLKNDKGLLPLDAKKYGSIMVLGPNAGAMDPMVGNYHGMSGNIITFAEGITAAAGAETAVQYDQGSDFTDTVRFGGIWAAGESDITIAVIGLTPVYEGEGGDAFLAANGGDKLTLDLPAAHIALLKALRKKNKPVVAVVTAGSNVDIAAIEPYADAIVLAWYPGEQGGHALADILFGKVSPAGRLPVTFYHSLNDLPAYDSYAMRGRTYRYYDGKVQYPFGYGLSYTSFAYEWSSEPAAARAANDTLRFAVSVKNTGLMDGDEVIQVYIRYPAIERMPLKELKAFRRVHIRRGESAVLHFAIPFDELRKWDLNKKGWVFYPGEYRVMVGGHSQDIRMEAPIHIGEIK